MILLIAIASGFVSCTKHEHDVQPEGVSISIHSPQLGLAYQGGDSVKMHVSINSPSNLHGYEIHIAKLSDSTEVFAVKKDGHVKQFDINEVWVYDGNCHSEMELTVIANIDHHGNKATKEKENNLNNNI